MSDFFVLIQSTLQSKFIVHAFWPYRAISEEADIALRAEILKSMMRNMENIQRENKSS